MGSGFYSFAVPVSLTTVQAGVTMVVPELRPARLADSSPAALGVVAFLSPGARPPPLPAGKPSGTPQTLKNTYETLQTTRGAGHLHLQVFLRFADLDLQK